MTMWSPNKNSWDDDEDDVSYAYKTVMNSNGESVTEEVSVGSNGYTLLQEDTIKCADCGKKLVDVIKVKENQTLMKVVTVECPCGGSSFVYEITGETYLQAAKGREIGDMPTDIIDDVIHLTIKVIK